MLSTAKISTTMPVEPGFVDANILVYAMDADAPQHEASRGLLEAARRGSTTLFVTLQVLCEFYSVVTSARRVPKPRSAEDALNTISNLLTFLRVLPIPAQTVEAWVALVRRHPVTGADVFDLHIVAAMVTNDVKRIYTFNTGDFAAFPELVVTKPELGD